MTGRFLSTTFFSCILFIPSRHLKILYTHDVYSPAFTWFIQLTNKNSKMKTERGDKKTRKNEQTERNNFKWVERTPPSCGDDVATPVGLNGSTSNQRGNFSSLKSL